MINLFVPPLSLISPLVPPSNSYYHLFNFLPPSPPVPTPFLPFHQTLKYALKRNRPGNWHNITTFSKHENLTISRCLAKSPGHFTMKLFYRNSRIATVLDLKCVKVGAHYDE